MIICYSFQSVSGMYSLHTNNLTYLIHVAPPPRMSLFDKQLCHNHNITMPIAKKTNFLSIAIHVLNVFPSGFY